MEVYGNVEALKKAIERKYSSKIKQIEKDKEKQLAEVDKILKKKLDLLKSHMKTETDSAVKKAHSMILSSEKLKAKKEFEEKREALIDSVFKEAEKKAKKVIKTKEYLDYVKSRQPEEDCEIVGCEESYKNDFADIKIDKNVVGMKFKAEGIAYDFSLDNLIDSKKDILRHEVSKVLFKDAK